LQGDRETGAIGFEMEDGKFVLRYRVRIRGAALEEDRTERISLDFSPQTPLALASKANGNRAGARPSATARSTPHINVRGDAGVCEVGSNLGTYILDALLSDGWAEHGGASRQ
jgi:hypothetical protein